MRMGGKGEVKKKRKGGNKMRWRLVMSNEIEE